MAHFFKTGGGRRADGAAVVGREVGMRRLDRLDLPAQRIIGGVADFRRVLPMVERVVMADLPEEIGVALVGRRHALDPGSLPAQGMPQVAGRATCPPPPAPRR